MYNRLNKGNWDLIKGMLTDQWDNLTDADLDYAEGEEEELIKRIQKRTGANREAVDEALRKIQTETPP
ncbi:MAG: CsbD family protein [Luteolibacter sp.]